LATPHLEDVPTEDRCSVGGPIDRSAVSLRIMGEDLDPEEISRLLGREPSSARKTVWVLRSQLAPERELDAKVADLLSSLPADPTIWSSIAARHRIDLFCGVFLNALNRGFGLSVRTLRMLAERGIEIGFDIYAVRMTNP
jgi:hypothetical protein